jgi:Lon protease-like protein
VPSLLPLFPLDVVLFPGTPLPLHIFEPRYQEMIADCLAHASNFGVIRAMAEGMAEVGCTAEIITVTKEYPDGRLDIVTEGRQRFQVLQLNEERSFLRAEVSFLEDENEAPSEHAIARAIQLHAEILNMAGALQDLSAADQTALSFYLAGSLPLDLDFKQQLLSLRAESQRISALTRYLEVVIPRLRSSTEARERAGSNGHGR